MTVIVGLVDTGQVWMGGDSASSNEGAIEECKTPKVFARGSYVIGFCHSYRIGNLLRYGLTMDGDGMPEPPDLAGLASDNDQLTAHMVNDWVGWLRRCLSDNGQDAVNDTEVSCLVATRGRLFEVTTNFGVLRRETYAAMGAGAWFALGSLHSTGALRTAPDQRVILALRAAAGHSQVCGEPFTLMRNVPG